MRSGFDTTLSFASPKWRIHPNGSLTISPVVPVAIERVTGQDLNVGGLFKVPLRFLEGNYMRGSLPFSPSSGHPGTTGIYISLSSHF